MFNLFSTGTSGKQRQTLKGKSTLAAFDFLKDIHLADCDDVCTEMIPTDCRDFGSVMFIDTPGLFDRLGDTPGGGYSFDVESVICQLAHSCDLVNCTVIASCLGVCVS